MVAEVTFSLPLMLVQMALKLARVLVQYVLQELYQVLVVLKFLPFMIVQNLFLVRFLFVLMEVL